MKYGLAIAALGLALALAPAALAAPKMMVSGVTPRPEHVGQCFLTRVKRVETRLEDNGRPVPDSGSAIELADGRYNVSYDQVSAMDRSRPGDPVRLCVVPCPATVRTATPAGSSTALATCAPACDGEPPTPSTNAEAPRARSQ